MLGAGGQTRWLASVFHRRLGMQAVSLAPGGECRTPKRPRAGEAFVPSRGAGTLDPQGRESPPGTCPGGESGPRTTRGTPQWHGPPRPIAWRPPWQAWRKGGSSTEGLARSSPWKRHRPPLSRTAGTVRSPWTRKRHGEAACSLAPGSPGPGGLGGTCSPPSKDPGVPRCPSPRSRSMRAASANARFLPGQGTSRGGDTEGAMTCGPVSDCSEWISEKISQGQDVVEVEGEWCGDDLYLVVVLAKRR